MRKRFYSVINSYRQRNGHFNRWVKRFLKWRNERQAAHPEWLEILNDKQVVWENASKLSKNGDKVLIGTSIGQYLAGTSVESVLAVALTLRGADVHVLLCDSFLPACFACDISWYPNLANFIKHGPVKDLCSNCFNVASGLFASLGVTVHRYSDLVTIEEQQWADRVSLAILMDEIPGYVYERCNVGEHALAGTLRFYARGTLEGEPEAEKVLRRFFKAALLTMLAVGRLAGKIKFEAAVFHHGIYVPQGLLGEVLRRENIRIVNWNPAYRKKTFIFSHQDTYHHTLMSEPVDVWENIQWNSKIESALTDYLKSRWSGVQDWIWFHESPNFNLSEITGELGIDPSKPSVGLLTNVIWDAQLHYPVNAFPSMLDWLVQTIGYFSSRPDLNLIIRVHPAEIRGTIPSRQSVVDEIRKAFPVLPSNVFVITPQSTISTYVAMSICDSVIIYGTKTGVELTSMGIPVIVAGEAWVRNKGITLDASTNREYFELLESLPLLERMNEDKIRRARKYAYHFFFRRMIPLEFFEPTGANPPYRINLHDLDQLLPGRSKGLDVICNGILDGNDFIYPAEKIYT